MQTGNNVSRENSTNNRSHARIRVWATLVALLVLVTFFGACSFAPVRHAWLPAPESDPIPREWRQWSPLPTNQYAGISSWRISEAVAKLQDTNYRQVSPDEVSTWVAGSKVICPEDHRLYLIRGVAWDGPSYYLVRFDNSTGRAVVECATYNGEMLMPGRSHAEPFPVIAALPREPTTAHVVAYKGGDGIFRGLQRSEVRWPERLKLMKDLK
jgi:hypothetical protein